MENVLLIRVDTEADLTGLDAEKNMVVLVESTGVFYRGNESGEPVVILDGNTPTLYANQFMFL